MTTPTTIETPKLTRITHQFVNAPNFWLLMTLIAAAGLKVWLLLIDAVPFNSDEAVVGLMARHILEGERPIFFYGQAYMGSLDAFLVALFFSVLGSKVWVIRLVQSLLYLGVIFTTYLLGKRGLGSTTTGIIAAVLLAIPTVNVTLYTTASLGGYGEALLLGNVLLLCVFEIARRLQPGSKVERKTLFLGLGWGVLVGLGLWANALSMVYAVPAAIYLLWKIIKTSGFARGWPVILAAAPGFFLGSIPWWIYAAQNGLGQLLGELGGGAVAVEQGSYIVRAVSHFSNLLLLGGTVTLGLRPPWEVRWLALPLLPFVLIIWAGIIVLAGRGESPKETHWEERRAINGIIWTLAAGFIFTSFGVDPSGRYFVPLAIPLALAAGEAVQMLRIRWVWRGALIAGILIFNLWGTLQCAYRYPPGITTQFYSQTIVDHRYMDSLVTFLEEKGETRGYTNYWVAYPLAFSSAEDLIFVPRLPYHIDLRYTSRDDRYEPYTELLENSPKTAFITARNDALDVLLRSKFNELGVQWQEEWIGDYHVYYELSQPVRPAQIGLGMDTK